MARKKLLVAGASGLVGSAAVRHFCGLPDWEVTAVSRRPPHGAQNATFVAVDLTDAAQCAEVFGRMRDVTHIIYAAVHETPGLFDGFSEAQQIRRNGAMLSNLLDPLDAAAKNLQHVSLMQGTKAYGLHLGPFPAPARERWPRHAHENFYWLQEDYVRQQQRGKSWHWTIWRPQVVVGESPAGNLNTLVALGVYAAILRERGEPLYYPGGASYALEASDVDIIARAFEWATTTDRSHNETFNITNGDIFVWQNVWPVLARAFGMEAGPARPCSIARELAAWKTEWAAIVARHGLAAPTDIEAFVGQSAYLADYLLACGDTTREPNLVSTIKLRQAGFHDCIDTEDMFVKWIGRLQALRWLPAPGA